MSLSNGLCPYAADGNAANGQFEPRNVKPVPE